VISIGKIQPSEIMWAAPKLKKAFYKLRKADPNLFKQIDSALDEIEKNAFCSILLPKRLMPKKWEQYPNVWKYDLPKGWRLFYTVAPPDRPGKIVVLSIILNWMSHKEYERLFKY
jgi:mRNA-degrading endonuclease RelE of RelBE toxin-antitoxin system|tara:strand:+ start:116865 stop:117209 length:345 start_codon:yes stop_codon:yes gene_type:complete